MIVNIKKIVITALLFLICVSEVSANNLSYGRDTFPKKILSEDTICIPMSVSSKLIDSLLYLEQYKRYSLACDELLKKTEERTTFFGEKITHLNREIYSLEQIISNGEKQIQVERVLSLEWQNLAGSKDIEVIALNKKIVKIKNTNKFLYTIGGIVILGLVGCIVLIKIL